MMTEKDGLTSYHVYESINDVMEKVSGNSVTRLVNAYGIDWVGEPLRSIQQLKEKLASAWKLGIQTVEKFKQRLTDSIKVQVHSHVRRMRYGEDSGDEICVDRLRSGQPFWREVKRQQTTGSTEVTVLFNLGANAQVESLDFMWRGAVAFALCEILEQQGYRVELWAIDAVRCNDGSKAVIVEGLRMKRASEPLDVSSLSASISGWFYRLGLISAQAQVAIQLGNRLGHGEGTAMIPTARQLDRYSMDENRIFVAGVYNFDAAVSLVEAELNKLNERNR